MLSQPSAARANSTLSTGASNVGSHKRKRRRPEQTRPTEPVAQRVPRGRFLLVAAVAAPLLAGVALVAAYLVGFGPFAEPAAAAPLRLEDIPFNGARAYEYLKKLCQLGPRPSGSAGMAAQQKLLAEHFQKLGGKVELQRFTAPHPQDGSKTPMANLIVHWHPESKERLLLCTHYDTLPFPMRDPEDPWGRFVGANDGTSGVALLMELAHQMPDLKLGYGVDFVLLDGEEFIFDENGRYFLGSEYFARAYAANPPGHKYRWGVLLDMIGDRDLQIYQERYSMMWPDTRPLVGHVWSIARRLGVRDFIPREKYEVRDDHLPLHDLGKIPCIDVIDFDYPYWHTRGDVPERCSALSLAKVGWVISEWLKEAK